MTAIPLIVPHAPPEWVLLDLQGDISLLRRPSASPSPFPAPLLPLDKPPANAVEQYGHLELGTVHLHHGRPQLRIGNALLDCQLRPLKKPLLVMRRSRDAAGQSAAADAQPRLHCVAVVRLKVSVVTRPVPIIVSTPGPMPQLA